MNKIQAIKILIQNPLAVIIEGIKARKHHFFKNKVISEYGIEMLPSISILDLIPNLDEEISCYSFLSGTSLITDLVLLKSLARKFDSCAYLEIGSWRGESIVNLSDITDDCTSLTLSADGMRELNFGEEFIKVHGVFSRHINTINSIKANSQTFNFDELQKKFDLIFIDGDHSYEGILNDTRNTFPLRKNNNSIIVWHDYSFNSEDTRHITLKAILDAIPKENHKNLYHVSNTMCAIYIEDQNHQTVLTKFPSFPDIKFSLNIVGSKIT